MPQHSTRTTHALRPASGPPEPSAGSPTGHELVVRREDRRPVECRICGRRNYAMADGDRRHPLFAVGSTPAVELSGLYLCHDHLRDLKQQLEAVIGA